MEHEDELLLQRIKAKDRTSFQEFVDRHKKDLYFLALNLTGNHHDAEDLSQEVFMKAFRSIESFRGDATFRSWLHRITLNAFLTTRKRSSFRIVKQQQYLSDEETLRALPLSDSSQNPERKLVQRSLQKAIDSALDDLSPRERSVFVLRHYNEMALKQIAESLDLREGTIKAVLFRALRKLQKSLSAYRQADWEGASS